VLKKKNRKKTSFLTELRRFAFSAPELPTHPPPLRNFRAVFSHWSFLVRDPGFGRKGQKKKKKKKQKHNRGGSRKRNFSSVTKNASIPIGIYASSD
jgi:hypothetical protein